MPSILRTPLVGFCLAAVLGLAGSAVAAGDSLAPPQPAVTVRKDGNKLAIDVKFTVQVPAAIAWEVLTDFDHMAQFVPNLSASEAVSEAPNLLRVKQKGTANWGPLSFDFESVRRIRLHPMSRIEATTLSGKISKMSSLCQLVHADNGAHVQYHADAEIDFWLPPLFGTSAIRHEMEEQFGAIAAEMLKRNASH